MRLTALIPAYNEAENIGRVITEVRRYLPEARIVVVDDGSTDRTRDILRADTGITALHHPYNVGIGGAIRTGFQFFLNSGDDYLIRFDGDGQHPPSQAKNLLAPLLEDKADAVIGSRFLERKGFQSSMTRRGGIKLLSLLSGVILGQRITDNTSGFKAYSRPAVDRIIDDYPHDYPEPIEVYLMAERHLRLLEVPVAMKERQAGLSSIGLLETYYYLFKVLLTIAAKHLIGGRQ